MIRKGSIWIAPDLPSLPYKIFSPVLMIRLLLLIVCHIYQQSIFLDFFYIKHNVSWCHKSKVVAS